MQPFDPCLLIGAQGSVQGRAGIDIAAFGAAQRFQGLGQTKKRLLTELGILDRLVYI